MRIRVVYSVGPDLRFLGNFDMMHLVERALRRAGIDYCLTVGFNPHIKLSMGTILPVGVWGEAEFFDLEVEDGGNHDFIERMNRVLPEGMHIHDCREISPETPAIMKVINAAAYTFRINLPFDRVKSVVEEILGSSEILVQSRGKKKDKVKDLRKGIYSAKAEVVNSQSSTVTLVVSVNEPMNIRYDELLDMLHMFGLTQELVSDYFRQANYIKEADFLYSPLEKVI